MYNYKLKLFSFLLLVRPQLLQSQSVPNFSSNQNSRQDKDPVRTFSPQDEKKRGDEGTEKNQTLVLSVPLSLWHYFNTGFVLRKWQRKRERQTEWFFFLLDSCCHKKERQRLWKSSILDFITRQPKRKSQARMGVTLRDYRLKSNNWNALRSREWKQIRSSRGVRFPVNLLPWQRDDNGMPKKGEGSGWQREAE